MQQLQDQVKIKQVKPFNVCKDPDMSLFVSVLKVPLSLKHFFFFVFSPLLYYKGCVLVNLSVKKPKVYFKDHVSVVPVGLVRPLSKSNAHPQKTNIKIKKGVVPRTKDSLRGEEVCVVAKIKHLHKIWTQSIRGYLQ